MKILTTYLFFMITVSAIGQTQSSAQKTATSTESINLRFDLHHLKYPALAKEYGIQGKVVIMFDIDSTCSIVNRRVTKGIGAGCEEEAMKTLDAAEKDLKKTNGDICPAVKNWTHEVFFNKKY